MAESDFLSLEKKRELIMEAIQEKKGHQILSIDLSRVENSICECFIICHGESNTQVGAIATPLRRN